MEVNNEFGQSEAVGISFSGVRGHNESMEKKINFDFKALIAFGEWIGSEVTSYCKLSVVTR